MADQPVQDGSECRICRATDPELTLLRPCDCKGSVGFVHLECLSEWVKSCQSTNRDWENCEICKKKYKIRFKAKSFLQWSSPILDSGDKWILIIAVPFLILMSLFTFYFIPKDIISTIISTRKSEWNALIVLDIIRELAIDTFCFSFVLRFGNMIKRIVIKWKGQNVTLVPDKDIIVKTKSNKIKKGNKAAEEGIGSDNDNDVDGTVTDIPPPSKKSIDEKKKRQKAIIEQAQSSSSQYQQSQLQSMHSPYLSVQIPPSSHSKFYTPMQEIENDAQTSSSTSLYSNHATSDSPILSNIAPPDYLVQQLQSDALHHPFLPSSSSSSGVDYVQLGNSQVAKGEQQTTVQIPPDTNAHFTLDADKSIGDLDPLIYKK
ncbi:MAG: hypothetical protein EZS28_002217 [Streblomastix strix]|uniref:RING-CH-type domain-containing protein n=1 Tax=Streblomastix strix TaxID=222440 RepID=A0A5J4X6I5_9EUKA|nr:MAG: hypothetical protein EZS28_002217 [Streblomastix strix]